MGHQKSAKRQRQLQVVHRKPSQISSPLELTLEQLEAMSPKQQINAKDQAAQAYLNLPRDKKMQYIKNELRLTKQVSPAIQKITGLITKLLLDMQTVRIAVAYGTDTQCRETLAPYKKEIAETYRELGEAIAELTALGHSVETIIKFDTKSELESVDSLLTLANKYYDTLVYIFALPDRPFTTLRELISTTPDMRSILKTRPLFGGSRGVSPTTRMLVERTKKYRWDRRYEYHTFQNIAELIYADLLGVKKRSSDEIAMLEWFDAAERHKWGKRLNDLYNDYLAWEKSEIDPS